MQNEIAVQGAHAFMSHIYTLIYITHGAWAIVCYYFASSPELYVSNANSPHAPFFMCKKLLINKSLSSGDIKADITIMSKNIIIVMLSILMVSTTTANSSALRVNSEGISQNEVLYHFGTRTFDKDLYIQNIKDNVAAFIDFKRQQYGWNSYYIEEFKNAYFRYINAMTDIAQPNRFYTDEFGTLIDKCGEFSNEDLDDYWYDRHGNRITGEEYRNLKDSKKKKYFPFLANKELASFLNQIGKGLLKALDSKR